MSKNAKIALLVLLLLLIVGGFIFWLSRPKGKSMSYEEEKEKDLNYCVDGINQLTGLECGIQSTRSNATLIEEDEEEVEVETNTQDTRSGATIVGRYRIL